MLLHAAPSFKQRQLFVRVCLELSHSVEEANRQLVADVFIPPLVALSDDPVANVRLRVAIAVRDAPQWLRYSPRSSKALASATQMLCADEDPDVAYYANKAAQRFFAESLGKDRDARFAAIASTVS